MLPGPAGPIPARVYRPLAAPPTAAGHPVVAYFHGGGWIAGDLVTNRPLALRFCAALGAIVIDVDYRRAPEHRFPAAYDDCLAAARWAVEHAGDLGGDASRVAVAGQSAGAQLAASVALGCRDLGLRLAAQVLIAPVVDCRGGYRVGRDAGRYPSRRRLGEGYGLTREGMETFARYYGVAGDGDGADSDWRASPICAPRLAGAAPAIVHVAGFDLLRDEGVAYADALGAAGVAVTLRVWPTLNHGYISLGGVAPAAEAAVNQAFTDLAAVLAAAC